MNILGELRPHFSFSQLDNYLSCPHKYYLGYEQETPWCFVPSAVLFGSTVHSVLEGFHRSLIAGTPQSKDQLQSLFSEGWERQTSDSKADTKIRWKNQGEQQDMRKQGKELVAIYHDQFHTLKPHAVELDFRLPMVRSDTGELGDRDIVGKVDVVENEGGLVPLEIKTSSRSLAQSQADINMQLTLYSWALTMMYGEHVGTVKIVNLVRTKQPKIQVVETQRTAEDHQKLMRVLFGVNNAIDKQVFFANPNNSFGCRNCTFAPICEFATV